PHLEVFTRFNPTFLTGERHLALPSVKQMHAARWPDAFQGEWPGFYLEYRFQAFLTTNRLTDRVRYVKEKRPGEFDYDLAFEEAGTLRHYGDLKASDHERHEAPGNDAAAIYKCVNRFGKF